jgi:cytochrome c-type biogenesis protein
MDSSVFFGGSVIAATVAGVIALFAPCCISVMLPAYFASSFQNRGLLVAMTFLFAAGVATVILPLAMGASALRQLFTEQHTLIYGVGGLIMVGLGAYTLLGGQLHIPVPGRRAGGKGGPFSVYSLGVFSGVASSCCAPVLAGVIALSGIASSFGLALGLGAAYVFGMVAPLFIISLLWERYDWRSSRLFRPRSFTYRLGPLRRTITGTSLASGILLALMGTATLYVGLAYDAMPASGGWQARLSAELQRYGQTVTDALSWVPSWAAAIILLAIVALLALRALGQVGHGPDEEDEEPKEEIKEETLEQREA